MNKIYIQKLSSTLFLLPFILFVLLQYECLLQGEMFFFTDLSFFSLDELIYSGRVIFYSIMVITSLWSIISLNRYSLYVLLSCAMILLIHSYWVFIIKGIIAF